MKFKCFIVRYLFCFFVMSLSSIQLFIVASVACNYGSEMEQKIRLLNIYCALRRDRHRE